jgi:hypothetical protein
VKVPENENKAYKMKIAEELKNNLIADVENICEISLSEETRESLKRCFEITVGTHSLSLPPAEGTEIAEALYKWLSQQKYGDEALLHPAVCCDFVGMTRFKAALAEQIKINLPTQQQPTAEGAEEILAKGKVLMFGHVIVDPIMLPEGIYATKELRIYLPGTTIEHLMGTGKSFRDKTQTRWLPDSYFDNLSKCELIDVDVVRDATLHAQKIADKMVSERLRETTERCKKLEFMIDKGLGWKDMENDITMPHEL